jgi:murein DD-endopeptidase MepM/ murein hydrolase activator NlpD
VTEAYATAEGETPDSPDRAGAESRIETDQLTGEVSETNENDPAVESQGGAVVTTGSPDKANRGVPDSVEDEGVNETQTEAGASEQAEDGINLGAVGQLLETLGLAGDSPRVSVAGLESLNTFPDNPLPTAPGILPESVTGLPTQQIGAIDLATGRARAEVIRDEARRDKSYESNATIVTTPEALTLAPGSIFAFSNACFQDDKAKRAFAREWRISRVVHTFRGGALTTSLKFYTPQAQKPERSTSATQPPSASPQAGTAAQFVDPDQEDAQIVPPSEAGSFIFPMKPGWNSCGAICEFGYARGRLHAGLDMGGYSDDNVFAPAEGVVSAVSWDINSGAGRLIDIEHGSGIKTRYFHLQGDIAVSVGDSVTQGQFLATRGGSGLGGEGIEIDGAGYNIHLHWETHVDGTPIDPRDFMRQYGDG